MPISQLGPLLQVPAAVERRIEPVVNAVGGVPHHAGQCPLDIPVAVVHLAGLVAEHEPAPPHDHVLEFTGQVVPLGIGQGHRRGVGPALLDSHDRVQPRVPVAAEPEKGIHSRPHDERDREGVALDPLAAALAGRVADPAKELKGEIAVEIDPQLERAGVLPFLLAGRQIVVKPWRQVGRHDVAPLAEVFARESVVGAAVAVGVAARRFIAEPDILKKAAIFLDRLRAVVDHFARPHTDLVPARRHVYFADFEHVGLAEIPGVIAEQLDAGLEILGHEEAAARLGLWRPGLPVERQRRLAPCRPNRLIDGSQHAMLLEPAPRAKGKRIALVGGVVAHAVPIFEHRRFEGVIDRTPVVLGMVRPFALPVVPFLVVCRTDERPSFGPERPGVGRDWRLFQQVPVDEQLLPPRFGRAGLAGRGNRRCQRQAKEHDSRQNP